MASTAEHIADSSLIQIRIIRDSKNRDGWSARNLSDSKLCFIENIDTMIQSLEAGQIWSAEILDCNSKFLLIRLHEIDKE